MPKLKNEKSLGTEQRKLHLSSLLIKLGRKDLLTEKAFGTVSKAISELEQLEATEELKRIGVGTPYPVAIEAVNALEQLKAVKELKYIFSFALCQIAEEAAKALERINSSAQLTSQER